MGTYPHLFSPTPDLIPSLKNPCLLLLTLYSLLLPPFHSFPPSSSPKNPLPFLLPLKKTHNLTHTPLSFFPPRKKTPVYLPYPLTPTPALFPLPYLHPLPLLHSLRSLIPVIETPYNSILVRQGYLIVYQSFPVFCW